jgi:hypothetical protein
LLFLWSIWSFGYPDTPKIYDISWQFDEVLYAYLVWAFFSLLNLSYITFKNNKVKLYFPNLLIIFLSLISIYFIFSIGNIYKLNFPDQFLSLYINSVVFIFIILLTFIFFTKILFKNDFNKHNFILINSYFFLIILFIAMIFIVVNKPGSSLFSDYPYFPSIIMTLRISLLFLFIPFVNFLFLFLMYFFKKHKIVPIIIIIVIAFWDMLLALFKEPLLALETYLRLILYLDLQSRIFISLIFGIGIPLYYRMLRTHSFIQMVVLLNMIMMLIYLGVFYHEFSIGIIVIRERPIPVPLHLDPVYDLASSIIIIILFLIFVNLVIYLRARLK